MSHANAQAPSDVASSEKPPGIVLSKSALQHTSQGSGVAGKETLAADSGGRQSTESRQFS